MNGEPSEADKVFEEATRRNFTWAELNSIQFKPPDQDDPEKLCRISGRVKSVKSGYSIIEAVGYPPFLCPGSKFRGLVMKEGLKITFEPSFTAKGLIADNPEMLS
jgi:hypothetical protein